MYGFATVQWDTDAAQWVYVPAGAEAEDECEWFDTLEEAEQYAAAMRERGE